MPKANQIARELKSFLERSRPRQSASRRSNVPIQGVLTPAVSFALERLRRATRPSATKILTPSARKSLGRHLTDRLVFALTPTLRLEQRASEAVTGRANVTFLETLRAFPGVLETAAQLIDDWINAQRELLERLVRDEQVLRAHLVDGKKQIVAILPGLSDPHDGGRTVTLIEFSGNRRVIYKPRSCKGEQLWFSALRWLNRNGIAPSLRVPGLLPRKNHCWMEFLGAKACHSLHEVRCFYFRWGAQTALAEILAASDLHRENWIADGPQPILMDAETVGGMPERRKKTLNRPASAKATAGRQSLPALLETGLLPLILRDRAGRYRGIAPFDAMLADSPAVNCWPGYKGKLQSPWRYVRDLIRGFEAVAEIFAKPDRAREFFHEMTSRSAPIRKARVFFRSSAEYARLLKESLEPQHMTSQTRRSSWLAQKCCASARSRAVGLAEARALLRCDLPKFTTRRRSPRISWKEFSAAVAQLKRSMQLLRRRVLLGTCVCRR